MLESPILIELSGGGLPFASALSVNSTIAPLYYSCEDDDARVTAAANFPAGQNLGRLRDVQVQQVQSLVERHPGRTVIVTYGGMGAPRTVSTDVSRILSCVLECASSTTWIVGGILDPDQLTNFHRLPDARSFHLQSSGASPVSSLSHWCTNWSPSWPKGTRLLRSCDGHVSAHPSRVACACDYILDGWQLHAAASSGPTTSLQLDKVWHMNLLTCARTGRTRRLIAQELEGLLGYEPCHTAPLLQGGVQSTGLHVEARRVMLLQSSIPVCISRLLVAAGAHVLRLRTSADVATSLALDPVIQETAVRDECALRTQQLDELRKACPYLCDRQLRGLCYDGVLGPDWADMHAYQAARMASGIQHKQDGFAASRRRLLPYGLPPELHALLSEALYSPLASLSPIADDLDYAIRTVVSEGAGIRSWRQRQWRLISKHLRHLSPLQAYFAARRTPSALRVSSHLDPATMYALCHSIKWPDMSAAEDLCSGVQIVGALPTFGIYRAASQDDSADGSSFNPASNREWLEELFMRKPPPSEQAQVIFEKSEKERELGILEGWFSAEDLHTRFGLYQWRHMIRFATWQENHGAYRCIDNAKSSEHNLCTTAEERIHTTSVDMGMAICQRFRKLIGQPLCGDFALHASTKDMKRAYRQIPVGESHLQYSIVAVWHPKWHRWVFGILHGLAFGLLAAVLQFNRYPAALVAIARRWLAIPVINFFDDFKLTEPMFAKGSGAFYFDKLVDAFGWLFDPDKDRPFRVQAQFLGGMETYLPDAVQLQPLADRVEAVRRKLCVAISTRTLRPKDALTLSGKLVHFARFFVGRIGRGQTHAITEHGTGNAAAVSQQLLHSLQFHLALLDLKPYRRVSLIPDGMPHRVVYTDASCELQPPLTVPVVQVAWIVLDTTHGVSEGGFLVVPDEVIRSFQHRDTYIAQGEAFGPLLAVYFHRHILEKSHTIFFVDNLGVLSALITGHARVADFGTIVHAFHLSMACLKSTCWFEHVESGANPSDGGSRIGASCPTARKLNVSLMQREFPPWPRDALRAGPTEWLSFLHGTS